MPNLLIVGPPGAGKGTQAARIATALGVPAVSTGDIFRQNIKEQTELGQRVTAILDAGDYVPDELTNELVDDRLAQDDAAEGYLLDGYPRTAGQVEFLDGVNLRRGEQLDAVIRLVADTEEVVRRLLARAEQQGRSDDTEAVIRRRLEVYERETAPLIAIFGDRDLVVEVDGIGAVDEVTDRILAGLAERGIRA
ncbi:adenylate kinase [Agrococcus sediminis]|uniref:Adenylate kinase n=1 Tax=Agrococcus sediminis TaxID=2599924 RepID=A0A5M8QGD6_9MICO|nr:MULTISPECIES: adenylate kinase [Agrococcus]KAA6435069.1 adenylate kinase [Agrococcus sediminis]MDR7233366.1 adenylate kinase [Agrococcus sp. BE272]RWR22450.1 adenylate kinase [Agrococcus lahaulensis]UOV99660.1 adenylate kinase [Agrococcus sp. SCSIO52902]